MKIFKFNENNGDNNELFDRDDIDYDDLYDDTEDLIDQQVESLDELKIVSPSIVPNDILDNCSQVIPLQNTLRKIQATFRFLEQEIDTIDLQRKLQPFEKKVYAFEKALNTSNQMIYLFDKIKKNRKRARRVSKKSKMIHTIDELPQLERWAEALLDQNDFLMQIEYFSSQNIDVSGLEDEYARMIKQLDKLIEALEEANDRLKK